MPLNLLAGVGGMSEYSMMTQGLPWEISYAIFTMGLVVVGWMTFKGLKFFENRKLKTLHNPLRD
jgi:magnesium transporter